MSRGVTNVFIEEILFDNASHFYGVFSNDNVNPNLKYLNRFSVVCNLSNGNEDGSHFVAIIALPTYVLYIDSFGLPCVTENLCEFLSTLNKPVYHNSKQIQDFYSNYCGFYCMLYVLYFDKERLFTIEFTDNLKKNDTLCIKYIISMMK